MAEDHEHVHEGRPEFSDEAIRRFLLGALNPSEQPLFEQRLMIDDELDARVRRIECQLADDYAIGRLPAGDRKLFEQNYLASKERKQTLLVSDALRDRFAGAQTRQHVPIFERLKYSLSLHRPVMRLTFGLIVLILLIGTAWLVTKEPRIAKRFIPRRSPAASPTPVQPSFTNHPSNPNQTPEHSESPPATQPHDSPMMASFGLSPNRRESASVPVVDIRQGKPDTVRFLLALTTNLPGTYRAELRTDEGQLVFNAESLVKDGSAASIGFDVSARLLKTSNYQIELSRVSDGSKETVASYYFLVRAADQAP